VGRRLVVEAMCTCANDNQETPHPDKVTPNLLQVSVCYHDIAFSTCIAYHQSFFFTQGSFIK